MKINKEEINDKLFLDEEGTTWATDGAAGTGEYLWLCRNTDTDAKKEFTTEFVVKRISSYNKDVNEFENKGNLESNMFNFIKKISEQILRKEILKEEDWSTNELDLLNRFKKGEFDIKCD